MTRLYTRTKTTHENSRAPMKPLITQEKLRNLDGRTLPLAESPDMDEPGKDRCHLYDPPYNTRAKDWKYNNAIRALAWAGPERVHEVLKEIEGKVSRSDLLKGDEHISLFPKWWATALSCSADLLSDT